MATYTVTSSADSGPGSLRDILGIANMGPATIKIRATASPITILSGLLFPTGAVITIESEDGTRIEIRNSSSTGAPLFRGNGGSFSFRNLLLIKADADTSLISFSNSNLDIYDCHFDRLLRESAVQHFSTGPQINTVRVDSCLFLTQNQTGSGGAIHIEGSYVNLDISNTEFLSGEALTEGGAISYLASTLAPNPTSITISSCNFRSNRANKGGACWFNCGTNVSITIQDTDFSDGAADSGDGQIISLVASRPITMTIINCHIYQCNNNYYTNKKATVINTDTSDPFTFICTGTEMTSNTGQLIKLNNNLATCTLEDCRILQNSSTDTFYGTITFSSIDSASPVVNIANTIFSDNSYVDPMINIDSANDPVNVQITDCQFTNNMGSSCVRCFGFNNHVSLLNITGSEFVNNTGNYAGLYIAGPYDFNIEDSTFSGNRGNLYGSAMSIFNTFGTPPVPRISTIRNCTFERNVGVRGGAVHLYSSAYESLTIEGSAFSDNNTEFEGGALYIFTSDAPGDPMSLNISTCQFNNNSTSTDGGALYFTNSNQATFAIDACQFSNNSASSDAGAIAFSTGTFTGTISNTVFENNKAETGNGGALFFDRSRLQSFGINSAQFIENSSYNGAAIFASVDLADVALSDVVVRSNRARNTAAVHVTPRSPGSHVFSTNNCQINDNSSDGTVGGIYFNLTNPMTITLTNTDFDNNNCGSTSTNLNAAALLVGHYTSDVVNVSLTGCTFSANSANNNIFVSSFENTSTSGTLNIVTSECIYVNNSGTPVKHRGHENASIVTSLFTNCTFNGNTARACGGIYALTNGTIDLSIRDSSFYDNVAGATGAIALTRNTRNPINATMSIANSTISGNTATGAESTYAVGGIAVIFNAGENATVTLTNSTVTNNVSSLGGIVTRVPSSTFDSIASLFNTIVSGNTTSDVFGTVTSNSANNFIGVDTNLSGITDGVNANQIGTNSSPLDPDLGPLSNNGGVTLTRMPSLTSAVRNAGNVLYANNAGLIYDQRGVGYPRIFDSLIDIGSIELQERPICYLGQSIVRVRCDKTGDELNIEAREVVKGKYHVYDIIGEEYVPVRANIVTGMTKDLILIEQDLLGTDQPFDDLYITAGHPLLIDGKYTLAKDVVGAKSITIDPEPIYSIATDKSIPIMINGLPVYTWNYQKWIDHASAKCISWRDNTGQ